MKRQKHIEYFENFINKVSILWKVYGKIVISKILAPLLDYVLCIVFKLESHSIRLSITTSVDPLSEFQRKSFSLLILADWDTISSFRCQRVNENCYRKKRAHSSLWQRTLFPTDISKYWMQCCKLLISGKITQNTKLKQGWI